MNRENFEQLPEGVIEVYGGGNMEAITIGKPFSGRWLFSSPEELNDEQIGGRKHLLEAIVPYALQANVATLAVPRVDRFNARITEIGSLPVDQAEQLSSSIRLLRGEQEDYFNDGFILRPGEGAIIVTGDCHTVAFHSENPAEPVIAVHAGRNSLHRVNHVHGVESDSVIFEALHRYEDPSLVRARIIAGIGPDEFTHPLGHPKYGAHNRELLEYFAQFGAANPEDQEGHLDIAAAIKGQMLASGMDENNIAHDNLDTTTDDRLWSNRQGETRRNTIMVLHSNHD